jgi:hypothetical protein
VERNGELILELVITNGPAIMGIRYVPRHDAGCTMLCKFPLVCSETEIDSIGHRVIQ